METKNIYAYNPKETEQASVFSKLMRNVYRWMTFALAITGLTAACVAGLSLIHISEPTRP